MKHTMKRLTALLFVVILLGAMLPTAFAADVLITGQPRNASAYAGEKVSTTVTAEGDGLTYQWYIAKKGSSSFSKSSITGKTYSTTMSTTVDGRQAYCIVKDKNGNSEKTNTVTLSMRTALSVTTQPKSVTVKEGATAKVTIAATGDGLSYTWYFKNPGATKFSKTSSFTGKTYSVAMDASRDGRQVYCVVKDKYGSTVQTNTATLSMQHPVKITAQPKTAYAYEGKSAKTTVTATGDGLTYAWYIASATGTKFSKSSITGATYSVKMSASNDGRKVYCIVTDKYGNSVQTNTVTLNVADTFAITQQPKSVAVKQGETAKVSFSVKGEGLTYTWYYKNAGADKFTKTTSFKSNSYSVAMDLSRDGRQVYCVVKDITGATLTTDTVSLGMVMPVKITQQPKDAYAYEGEVAKVVVGVDRENVTYTWYIASAGSTKFGKSSVTTNTYGTKLSATNNGRQVYCVISDAYGNTVQTKTVTLNIVKPMEIITQPQSAAVSKIGENVEVFVEAIGENLVYEWYYKNAGDSVFKKTNSFRGNTYSLEMTNARDGREVYCVITDITGTQKVTNVVELKIINTVKEKLEWVVDTQVNDDMTQYEIAVVLYDWVCANVQYDYDYYNGKAAHSSFGVSGKAALLDGWAVCQGFAEAYEWLLEEAGITAHLVTGYANSGGGHAWNIAQIDGVWYQFDPTWDELGDGDWHYYFALTDEAMHSDHTQKTHTNIECNDYTGAYNYRAGLYDEVLAYVKNEIKTSLNNGIYTGYVDSEWEMDPFFWYYPDHVTITALLNKQKDWGKNGYIEAAPDEWGFYYTFIP